MSADTKFCCDYAKRGAAGCKKCKQKCEKAALRIAKVVPNFFHDGEGVMKNWHHPKCLFETFEKARATTKIIESTDEIEGFTDLTTEDQQMIKDLIKDVANKRTSKSSSTPAKKSTKSSAQASKKSPSKSAPVVKSEPKAGSPSKPAKPSTGAAATAEPSTPVKLEEVKQEANVSNDNKFKSFRKLCKQIADHPGYKDKSNIVSAWLKKGSTGTGFDGDVYLTIKLLLPGFVKRVYNINSKQLAKLFSQIFAQNVDQMNDHLDQGDVADTVKVFFEKSSKLPPQHKSVLSLQEVDAYLEQMSKVTREDDQSSVLRNVAKRCTADDLMMFVRLVKHDLRINAGAKHILEGLDDKAYEAFQASRDLRDVVDRVMAHRSGDAGKLTVRASLMTPVLPMLAEACKSVDFAMKRCPKGMYAEIKYDGERVQLHKNGNEFQYFSRSLKPVLPHKVSHFSEHIPKAFPGGDNLILDAEVLLVDIETGNPLPFGTLGVHKKAAFKNASVCLYVFDCLYYNDENLMSKPISERRKFLRKVMIEIPNRVMFSEQHHITKPSQLNDLLEKVFKEGLEGLVLKGVTSIYEPGKRHWLKVKKDYLADGSMADTADLVVLGAYYGTGNKGGMMSVFLMGCYDPASKCWCTVTKVHGGHDDDTLKRLQTQLDMVKISKDSGKIPNWLLINKGTATPDFIITDPKNSQVWEITGAEFSKSDIHTADGISIRFPRVTKIRDDKDWKTATDLPRLKLLFEKSKETSNFTMAGKKPSKSSGSGSHRESPPSKSSSSDSRRESSPSSPKKRKADKHSDSTSTDLPSKRVKSSTEDDSGPAELLDIFKSTRVYVPESLEDFTKLKRYAIAYGAEIEGDAASANVTIVNASPADGQATPAWLYECIKQKTLLPKF